MKAIANPTDLVFTGSAGAVSIEGSYDPRCAASLTGLVTVKFTARLAGTDGDTTDRLRATETAVAAEVMHRLASYDNLVAERDMLRERLGMRASRPTSSGYTTAEIMLDNC
jgi:hypothetical protein